MSVSDIAQRFQRNVVAGNNDLATADLEKLKRAMVELESLPPTCVSTPNCEIERRLFTSVLEHAVLLAVQQGDRDAFQRAVATLRPFYTQFGYGDFGNDSITATVIALNLLHLLVDNRLADFHCELELLPEGARKHPAVLFCTDLEQRLVIGAYDMVMSAAANPPVQYFSFFLNSLLETVRVNIGECVGAAYKTLKIGSATKILMFSSDEETRQFVADNYPAWRVNGDIIIVGEEKVAKSEEIPSMKLIAQSLTYATELERIV